MSTIHSRSGSPTTISRALSAQGASALTGGTARRETTAAAAASGGTARRGEANAAALTGSPGGLGTRGGGASLAGALTGAALGGGGDVFARILARLDRLEQARSPSNRQRVHGGAAAAITAAAVAAPIAGAGAVDPMAAAAAAGAHARLPPGTKRCTNPHCGRAVGSASLSCCHCDNVFVGMKSNDEALTTSIGSSGKWSSDRNAPGVQKRAVLLLR